MPGGGGGELRGHEGEPGAPGPNRPVGFPVPEDFVDAGFGAGAGRRGGVGTSLRDVSWVRRPVVWKQLQVKGAPAVAPSPAGPSDPSALRCPRCSAVPVATLLGWWPGSILFLALPEPDSWVCDLGEERLWTWWCGGGGGGVLGSGGFRPPRTLQRPVAKVHPVESTFQSIAWAVLKQSHRLFTYLECCWELGFRSFSVYESDRNGQAGGWVGRRKDYSLKKCITQARNYNMKQGPQNLLQPPLNDCKI